ncbi:MAG: FAD-binding oxidoreductase, partial [Planctomycetes bacterium]|nr:FAD-binding oxidoreductase [Planctomycetota bacterium]
MATIETGVLDGLAGQLDGDAYTDDVSKLVYASAACIYRIEPLGVVHPKNAVDVALTVRFCREHRLPIIARGGGSGLAGQTVGRAVIIDFTRYMDALENIDADANVVRVQPGITHGTLNWLLEPHGKYFPPDPSSGNFATLGGMIANNASGSHALKYGNTIDYVRKLKLVTDTGEIIVAEGRQLSKLKATGGRAPELYAGAAKIALRYAPQIDRCTPKVHKNSSGYRLDRFIEHVNGGTVAHLQRLICGSEGTLGIIVEAELDVADPPRCTELLVLAFADLQAACDAVPLIMEMQPSALEAMDRSATTIVRERRPELKRFLPEDAQLLLFVEFDGPEREPLVEKTDRVKHEMLSKRKLAMRSIDTADAAEQQALWDVRKAVLPILCNLPGPKRAIPFIEDAAVPVPAIPAYMAGLKKILDDHDAAFVVLGHAGQGNFHVRPMINVGDPAEVEKMAQIMEQTTDLVLSLGGTLSGEHADGLLRTQFLRRQYGELYPAFEEIKKLFDPENIFNPGKIVAPLQT